MKFQSNLAAACASLSIFLGSAAVAASSASATLESLSIGLFDLTPGGGGVPWITFIGGVHSNRSYVSAHAFDYFAGGSANEEAYGTAPWSSVSAKSMMGGTAALAMVEGTNSATGTKLSASGNSAGVYGAAGGAYSANFGTSAVAPSRNPWDFSGAFTVSPYTKVVFNAVSNLSVAVTRSFDPAAAYEHENAAAITQLEINGPDATGSGSQFSRDSRYISVSSVAVPDPSAIWGYSFTGASASDTATITGSFENFTSSSLAGTVYFSAGASGETYAPIPEPGTSVLMLAGLMVLGSVLRRAGG